MNNARNARRTPVTTINAEIDAYNVASDEGSISGMRKALDSLAQLGYRGPDLDHPCRSSAVRQLGAEHRAILMDRWEMLQG